ncbi:MAG: YihA family ribosome biogenesis GTP-binding protein [Deltaproteobacteria bacterium]|nr:YihA family ribosome biogenesis GTP-binding protein [Deltaproteobacteria bacterium]
MASRGKFSLHDTPTALLPPPAKIDCPPCFGNSAKHLENRPVIVKSAQFVKSAVGADHYPDTPCGEVAFIGRSNVGKSTLINGLLGRRSLVRTSRTPGRTQTINFFLINDAFFLVDLPGYGFAKAPREVRKQWEPMIRGYLSRRSQLKAVILLLDIRRIPNEEDIRMLDWLEEYTVPTIPVLTKVDKVGHGERSAQMDRISRITALSREAFSCFSSVTREGREDIWDRIENALG